MGNSTPADSSVLRNIDRITSHGALVRRVEISAQAHTVRGVVEDDYHHFLVEISHRDGQVTKARGITARKPWSLCSEAAGELSGLVGMTLSPRSAAVFGFVDQFHQCTHMLDLAGLCVAAATRGVGRRSYLVTVPDRIEGKTRATVGRDGAVVLACDVSNELILGPAPFDNVSLGVGFTRLTQSLDEDLAEAALVLRRGIFIARGRGKNLDLVPHSAATGGCFVQQPHRAALATRVVGSTRDFSHNPTLPCSDDADWLAFRD